MKRILFLILMFLFVKCSSYRRYDHIYLQSKKEFYSLGFKRQDIKKVEVIDKGGQGKYYKIYYKVKKK